MGLKSGSRDAGLDDEEEESEETSREQEHEAQTESSSDSGPVAGSRNAAESTTPDSETSSDRPTMESIPYKLRRERVNEGREQVPFFLREDIIDAEDELQESLESMLGEDVYKSDYREAAMVVAQRKPELVAEVLREWGYDLDRV